MQRDVRLVPNDPAIVRHRGNVKQRAGAKLDDSPVLHRRDIASFHQPLFDTWLKGTRLVGQVTRVQFLAPDVALMHARGGTIMRGATSPSPARDRL